VRRLQAKTTAKRLKGLGKSLTAAKLRTHIEDENPLDKVVEAGAGNKSLKAPSIVSRTDVFPADCFTLFREICKFCG
jgi:hypothetical protein